MAEKQVIITDYTYEDVELERAILQEAGFGLTDCKLQTPQELIPAVRQADALIVQYANINSEVINSLEHCQLIVRYGAGIDNIDLQAATAKGIFVCNVPDYSVDEVSNHAIMMIMAFARRLPATSKYLSSGGWWDPAIGQITRLAGSTIGLIGFGRVAQMVARKLAAFNVNILAYHPRRDAAFIEARGAQKASLEEIAKHSDYISLHSRLDEESHHLVDAEFIKNMKPSSYLINTARGALIDETALLEALRSGRIAGAGLDVFETEPLPKEHPLLKLDNVILTPHCAWYSQEANIDLRRKAAQEVVRVLSGNMPANLCNKDALSNRS